MFKLCGASAAGIDSGLRAGMSPNVTKPDLTWVISWIELRVGRNGGLATDVTQDMAP